MLSSTEIEPRLEMTSFLFAALTSRRAQLMQLLEVRCGDASWELASSVSKLPTDRVRMLIFTLVITYTHLSSLSQGQRTLTLQAVKQLRELRGLQVAFSNY